MIQLNQLNPMVNVLTKVQLEAKSEIRSFSKRVMLSSIFNVVVATLIFILLGAYVRAGIHFFISSIIFYGLLRNTLTSINTKKIDDIIIENQEYQSYPNLEEVYEATRKLCEMNGVLKGRELIINVITLLTSSSLISRFIELFIELNAS